MHLKDIILKDAVIEIKSRTKQGVLKELASAAAEKFKLSEDSLYRIISEREKLSSTGIEHGIAIPHGKVSGLKNFILIIGRSSHGVDFNSPDNKPAHLFFLLLSPDETADTHLKILAEICDILSSEKIRENLISLSASEDIVEAILKEESRTKRNI